MQRQQIPKVWPLYYKWCPLLDLLLNATYASVNKMQSTFGVVLKNFVFVFKSISVLDDPAQILEKQYYLKFMNEIGCHKTLNL